MDSEISITNFTMGCSTRNKRFSAVNVREHHFAILYFLNLLPNMQKEKCAILSTDLAVSSVDCRQLKQKVQISSGID